MRKTDFKTEDELKDSLRASAPAHQLVHETFDSIFRQGKLERDAPTSFKKKKLGNYKEVDTFQVRQWKMADLVAKHEPKKQLMKELKQRKKAKGVVEPEEAEEIMLI